MVTSFLGYGRALLPALAKAPRDPRQVRLRRQRIGLRRLASAGLAAAALAGSLQVLAPDPPAGSAAVALARDLPAGAVLAAGDLRAVHVASAPRGAVTLSAATGRVLAAGARAGEVLTDARLAGPGLLTGQPPGLVAAPVRVADPAAAALAFPGDRVDVLLATEARADAEVVVRAVTVLARPSATASGADLLGDSPDAGGGLLVLGVSAADAAALAGAGARGPLTITLR